MNKCWIVILIWILNYSAGNCQDVTPGFAKYLLDRAYYSDLLLLNELDLQHLDNQQLDSINFYSGWASYNMQLLENGIKYFSSVGPESEFYNASRFFAGWSELYLGRIDEGMNLTHETRPATDVESELYRMFELGGSLMQKNQSQADSLLSIVQSENTRYIPQWQRMELHCTRLNNFNPKSYSIAGILSGILPGSGKIYADQKGAGISSFLLLGAMAAITLENAYKTGWNKWNTILAASFFSVFYVGNIYGSIVSVKIYRQRFFDELDRAILLDISIPLRDLYR